MEIKGDTIIFKSSHDFFVKERDGTKPNTIRNLNDFERIVLEEWCKRTSYQTIRIQLKDHPAIYFTRALTDISEWNGYHIFSWSV